VSVAVPEGLNPTTDLNYPLTLRGGDQSTLDFGAQASSTGQQPGGDAAPAPTSPILGLLGGVLVLGGIGLGVYMVISRRKTY
jgi:hypothetical protein